MKKNIIIGIGIVVILSIVILVFLLPQSETTKYQLISISGGDFIELAGYYEGSLNFVNVETQEEYSVFVCTEDWDWVVQDNCYNLDKTKIQENLESHISSGVLSGCFVGTFEEITC